MKALGTAFKSYSLFWKNYLRKDNLAMWFAILSILLGIQFFLIWQGIYRAITYAGLYYRPIRPFLVRWFGFPISALDMPIPTFSFLVLFLTLVRLIVIVIYIGAGIWLITEVGFLQLNIFYILYQVFK